MSAVRKIIHAVVAVFVFVLNSLQYLIQKVLGKKEQRIGELHYNVQPTAVISDGGQVNGGYQHEPQQNAWNKWTDESFGVESKIEEYRRKQQDAIQKKNSIAPADVDYFNDLKPEIKAAKRLDINQGRNTPQPRKNLFQFDENDVHIPQMNETELGEFEFDVGAQVANSAWDSEMDLNEVDQVYKAQRQKEREEKQKQRLLEHEKKIQQKKMKL